MLLAGTGSGLLLSCRSVALITKPLPAPRTMLLRKVTYSVTHHEQRPAWLLDLNTIAVPSWPEVHTFSKMFPSTTARLAFFNSSEFFTATRLARQSSRLVIR